MKKAEKETRREPLSPDACLPLGLPIGMCLGILYGSVFDKMPLGITCGCSLGLIIGVLLRSAVIKKQPPIREAFEEDFEEMAEVIRKSFIGLIRTEKHILPRISKSPRSRFWSWDAAREPKPMRWRIFPSGAVAIRRSA